MRSIAQSGIGQAHHGPQDGAPKCFSITIPVIVIAGLLLGLAPSSVAQPVQSAATPWVEPLTRWLLAHRGSVSGLPLSHVGDPRFENWCFTYDAAVTALALVAANRPNDARRILDFYIDTHHAHRLGGIIEAVSVEPPFAGKDWSVRTGANLWLGLAALHLFHRTDEARYLAFAVRIANFAVNLQTDSGGIPLGPPGDRSNAGDQHFGYAPEAPGFETVLSTEATIDAFALFNLLQEKTGITRFQHARERALDWLREVAWNPEEKRFNRGFHDRPDLAVASDTHAWGVSALGVERLEMFAPGAAEALIGFVERHCMSVVDAIRKDGTTVSVGGVDFVDHAALAGLGRGPLVSPEWTFQLANACLRMADDFHRLGAPDKASRYVQKRKSLLNGIMAMAKIDVDTAGFPYASLGNAPIGHEYRTPVDGNLSMIGVAYGILAWTGFDPLRMPGSD